MPALARRLGMGRRLRTLALTGLVAVLAGCGSTARTDPPAHQPVPPADAIALRDGNARFAGRLLATVARGPQNVALSPDRKSVV